MMLPANCGCRDAQRVETDLVGRLGLNNGQKLHMDHLSDIQTRSEIHDPAALSPADFFCRR